MRKKGPTNSPVQKSAVVEACAQLRAPRSGRVADAIREAVDKTVVAERARLADEVAWIISGIAFVPICELEQRLVDLEHRLSRGEP